MGFENEGSFAKTVISGFFVFVFEVHSMEYQSKVCWVVLKRYLVFQKPCSKFQKSCLLLFMLIFIRLGLFILRKVITCFFEQTLHMLTNTVKKKIWIGALSFLNEATHNE